MGGCGSSILKVEDQGRKHRLHCTKKICMLDKMRWQNSVVGNSIFVRTTIIQRNASSSSTYNLTPVEWHHNQFDNKVICQEESWFESVSKFDELDSDDDDFFRVYGDGFRNSSSGQVLQYETSSSNKINDTLVSGPQMLIRKSSVIRLSVKSTSLDIEETSETCLSRKSIYWPRAGLLIPSCTNDKANS